MSRHREIRRIAVNTGGGDAPGLNAVIRAIVLTGETYGRLPALLAKAHALGIGVLVGWGPTRTGTNVGPPYRMLMGHPIKKAFHSDGGDITVINPWLNFSTMITGRNLAGQQILGDQTLTRQETLWLATAATKWFIWEDDLGSIEVGKVANVIVTTGDPIDIRTLVKEVFVKGQRQKFDDRHTELYEKYRARPKPPGR